jgi:hypothetical protein
VDALTSKELNAVLPEHRTSRPSRTATVTLTSVAFFLVVVDLRVVITALAAMRRVLSWDPSERLVLSWEISATGNTTRI